MAARLISDLATTRYTWDQHLRASLQVGLLEPVPDTRDNHHAAADENLAAVRVGGERRPKLPAQHEAAAARIGRLLLDGGRGSLVLTGPAGSDRLLALGLGIGQAVAEGLSPHSLTLICPDQATALRLHTTWRREVGAWQPPIWVVGDPGLDGTTATEQVGTAFAPLTVLLEIQRMPTAERYRLCQQASNGSLISTVEPAESDEQWEHLFLATPAPQDVIHFSRQRRQARKIWQQVSQLLTPDGKASKSERRHKGECRAQAAANLDECMACLENLVTADKLTGRFSVVAPLLQDLAYLGRRMAALGWLPVFRHELEYLQLPGPLEFLAALADLTESDAQKVAARPAVADAGDTVAPDPEPAMGSGDSLLAPLLTMHGRRKYAAWREATSDRSHPSETVADFYATICRTGWAADFLSYLPARRRVEKLVTDLADEEPAQLAARPLWLAWRREVAILTGAEPVELSGPVVDLATPDIPGGRFARSLAYLCLGSETRRGHYRVMSRVTDHLLALYQEHSPLPGDGALPL
jgi:hypothetical protein